MAQPNQSDLAAQETIENTILDAVQKGLTRTSDLVSYCGPELVDVNVGSVDRELDVPQASRAIENLVQRGYLRRAGDRGLDQLRVEITDAGKEAAPPMNEREEELVSTHGISVAALKVLANVIEYQANRGSLPTLSQLQNETDIDLITYQIQPLYSQLLNTGLAENKGLFRFRIRPTDEGRRVVEEFSDLL